MAYGDVEESATPSKGNYELTRFNAVKHGVLSKHTVLPWEEFAEYARLVEGLVEEHAPKGPTEEHLIEELAGIMWRKRRLRLAENAGHARYQQLIPTKESVSEAKAEVLPLRSRLAALAQHACYLRATNKTDSEAEADLLRLYQSLDSLKGKTVVTDEEQRKAVFRSVEDDENKAHRALELIASNKEVEYSEPLNELDEEGRELWNSLMMAALAYSDFKPEVLSSAFSVKSLEDFIKQTLISLYHERKHEIKYAPVMNEQSALDAIRTEVAQTLMRHEIHLDRKFERTLTMLLKLKEMRRDIGGS
jgi:hypothetical protein